MKTCKIAAILIASMFVLTLIPLNTTKPASAAPNTTQTYPGTGPLPDGIVYKVYTDAIAEYLALKANEIDLMDWPIDKSQIPDALAQQAAGNLNVSEQADAGFYFIGMNYLASRFPMNVTGFRKALAHLVDKATVVATGLGGYGYVMDNIVPQGYYGFWGNHTVTTYAYSAILANQTLHQYGFTYVGGSMATFPFSGGVWKYNGNNIRDWSTTATDTLLLFARSDDPARKLAGEMLRDGLAQLDIPTTTQIVTSAIISPIVYYAPWDDWDIFTGGWGALGVDPTYIWDFFNTAASTSYNFIFWNNATYDYWSNVFVNSPDFNTVKAAAFKCEELVADGLPYIPLYERQLVTAGRTSWKGWVDQIGYGYPQFWSLMEAHKVGTQWGGQLRFGLAQDIKSLNIVTATWMWDFFVLNELYDGLVARDPLTQAWEPWMAQSYDVSIFNFTTAHDSPQGTKLTYVLRNNLTWHDGIPITSEDVKFTYEWLNYPASRGGIEAPRYGLPFTIHNVTTPDSLTAILYLNTTGYFAFAQSQFPIIPKHIWSRYTSYDQVQSLHPEREGLVIGSGPYAFVDYVPGEYCTLKAFTNYFRTPVGRPSIALGTQVSAQQGAAANIPLGKIYQNTTLGDVSGNRIDNATLAGSLYGGALITQLGGAINPSHEYYMTVDTTSLTPGPYEITANAYWTLVTAGSYQTAITWYHPYWKNWNSTTPPMAIVNSRIPMQKLQLFFEFYDGTNDEYWVPTNITTAYDGAPITAMWFNASLLFRSATYGWVPLLGAPSKSNTTSLTLHNWIWNGTSQSYDIQGEKYTKISLNRASSGIFTLSVWTGNLTNGAEYGLSMYWRYVNATTGTISGTQQVWAGRGGYYGDGWKVEWPTTIVTRAYVFGLDVVAPPAWFATGIGIFAIGATVAAVLITAGLGYSLLKARKAAK
jgi:ABC-type transport system substrate-binding protein